MLCVMKAACELVLELIIYDDKDELLRGLVELLTPSTDDVDRAMFNILQGHTCPNGTTNRVLLIIEQHLF